jgi:exodeoxyribonuclease VII large subunit
LLFIIHHLIKDHIMSEQIEGRRVFSLHEVAMSIQRTLRDRYTSTFWVRAELHKLNLYSHSGHCYPDLLEKSDDKIVAQFRAVLWKGDFERINASFIRTLREPLRDDIIILFEASIQFDPVYDLSLRIHDIDPTFSLGELERARRHTIEKLKKDGIFERNKALQFPRLPQRLAIISVETSKGYADFLKVIDQNPWGYKYFHMLFPALLQGEKAVESIIAALKKVSHVKSHFDVVLIVRGGGGDIGLSCYNHYELTKEIALFPLPVLTGVGHATNETISEMVSYRQFITPTEAATFLLQAFHNLSFPVERAEEFLKAEPQRLLGQEKEHLHGKARYFVLSVRSSLQNQRLITKQAPERISISMKSGNRYLKKQLDTAGLSICRSAGNFITVQKNLIQGLEKQASILDPQLILKRGFSITLLNGKAINDSQQAKIGDVIDTQLFQGKVQSHVEKISK